MESPKWTRIQLGNSASMIREQAEQRQQLNTDKTDGAEERGSDPCSSARSVLSVMLLCEPWEATRIPLMQRAIASIMSCTVVCAERSGTSGCLRRS